MDRKYRYFSKLLGGERKEINETIAKKLLEMKYQDTSPALAWLKCGQTVVVGHTLIVAEAVA